MPNEPWQDIHLACANYRVGVVGTAKVITVGRDKICRSDCEAVWCPLHKSQTHKLEVKDIAEY